MNAYNKKLYFSKFEHFIFSLLITDNKYSNEGHQFSQSR
jgi:hypothetical protein